MIDFWRTIMPAAPLTRRQPSGRVFTVIRRALPFAASVFLAWYFFYLLGQSLLDLPAYLQPDALWDTINQLEGNPP